MQKIKLLWALALVCLPLGAQQLNLQTQMKGVLPIANGGFALNLTGFAGCPKLAGGVWTVSNANCATAAATSPLTLGTTNISAGSTTSTFTGMTLFSPSFTGTATAATQSVGDRSSAIATDAFVYSALPVVQANGVTNQNQALLNFVAGSGITITTSANGTILLTVNSSASSLLPTPPANAYIYSNLQQQASSCPSSSNSAYNSTSSNTGCWTANSLNATGAAGAGVVAAVSTTFSNTNPSLSPAGSMMFGVTNPATQSPTATGTSGQASIVVSSLSGLGSNFYANGTGVGGGAQICAAAGQGACTAPWNGTSTTIPLSVVNSGTVNGAVTFSFVANALFANHLPVSLPSVIGAAVTSGTITVSPGTITANSNGSVSLANMTATDTTYPITAIQVIIDNSTLVAYSSASGSAPYSPGNFTTAVLSAGAHTITVKAFNNQNASALVNSTVYVGGASIATVGNLLDDFYYYIPSGQPYTAFEVDPDIFNYNPSIPGCSGTSCSTHMEASMQCDQTGATAPGQWRFWNTASNSWVRQDGTSGGTSGISYSCTAASTGGMWHHYQLYATFNVNAETYAYQTLLVDGAAVFTNLNLQYNGAVTGYPTNVNFINVQNQIDLNGSSSQTTPTIIYYDKYSLTAW